MDWETRQAYNEDREREDEREEEERECRALYREAVELLHKYKNAILTRHDLPSVLKVINIGSQIGDPRSTDSHSLLLLTHALKEMSFDL